MIGTYFISLLLMVLSGLLIDMHRRSWRLAQEDASLTLRDVRFARSQYRRRLQASGIIGVLGAAIGVYPLVPHEPWPIMLYLTWLMMACMAILLLAALDAWATRQNFVRLQSEHLSAKIKLARELGRDERM
jgi:peptidoglycan/LPS O-acetylase OafA/YrhL